MSFEPIAAELLAAAALTHRPGCRAEGLEPGVIWVAPQQLLSGKTAGTSLCAHKTFTKEVHFAVARLRMDLPFNTRLAFAGEVPALFVRSHNSPPVPE